MDDEQEKVKLRTSIALVATRPALAGAANCGTVLGPPWKHVRAHAVELGVPLLRIGRKDFVEVDAYLQAVRNNNSVAPMVATADPAEAVRSILRKAGGR